MNRPFGVTVIAVLLLISGLFGLCWPTLVFMGSAFLGPVFGTVGVIAGIFLIVGPLLQLIVAYGAFNLKQWAWYLGLISTVPVPTTEGGIIADSRARSWLSGPSCTLAMGTWFTLTVSDESGSSVSE